MLYQKTMIQKLYSRALLGRDTSNILKFIFFIHAIYSIVEFSMVGTYNIHVVGASINNTIRSIR